MKKLRQFTHHLASVNAEKAKDELIRILVTLIALVVAASPWVLLIARVTISGAE